MSTYSAQSKTEKATKRHDLYEQTVHKRVCLEHDVQDLVPTLTRPRPHLIGLCHDVLTRT